MRTAQRVCSTRRIRSPTTTSKYTVAGYQTTASHSTALPRVGLQREAMRTLTYCMTSSLHLLVKHKANELKHTTCPTTAATCCAHISRRVGDPLRSIPQSVSTSDTRTTYCNMWYGVEHKRRAMIPRRWREMLASAVHSGTAIPYNTAERRYVGLDDGKHDCRRRP